MYVIWLFMTIVCLITAVLSKSCLEVKLELEKNCQKRDAENYISCVRTRMKRQAFNCKYDEECFDCDCESCQYSQCNGQCNDCCHSCCTDYVKCHTNHCCHKQCHSECRTYSCRSSCRKSCYDGISGETTEENQKVVERVDDRIIPGSGSVNSNFQTNTSNVNSHNITTVINLKNVINNTNLIDVPINLNYTNRNNISLTGTTNLQGVPNGPYPGPTSRDDCCIIIGPRQCRQQPIHPYIRCFTYRSRQCGPICTAPLTEGEPAVPDCMVNTLGQRVCGENNPYTPPSPRCTYSNTWPYVRCETQPPTSCDACYGYYFNSRAKEYKCPPQCYNNQGIGQLYQQGSFYQPTYSQMPPCYLSPQGCGVGGLGGVGFGMMGAYGGGLDPGFGGGFGYAAQLPMSQPGLPFLQPQLVPISAQLLGNSIFTTANNQTFLNTSDKYQPHRNTPHLHNKQKRAPVHNERMRYTPFTQASPSSHKEVMDEAIINKYQADGEGHFIPVYDLPDREVKNPKSPFTKSIQKEVN